MGELRIVSRSGEAFANRAEAGRMLGEALRDLRGRRAVVLGIPRGGVITAGYLAREIEADLDIVLARKLPAPGNPELAIGAVTEDGSCWVDESLRAVTGADEAYVQKERGRQGELLRERAARYRAVWPKVALAGRPVVVTDDGVATGATLRVALRAARQEQPAELLAALPVGPEESLERLAEVADEVICLRVPPWFAAVGQFYGEFEQVDDEELLEMLAAQGRKEARP